MRGRGQLETTPAEWKRVQEAERARLGREARAELAAARDRGDDWYRWVLEYRRQRLERAGG